MSSLAVEAVLAQVAAVPTVSLPTGTERRKRLVGECKVKGEHFPSHIGESPMRLGSHQLLL